MSQSAVLLGEFEQMVLLAVLQAESSDLGAYGVTIFNELIARAKRRVARGAVYMTLDRLETKGLLSSYVTEPLPERGGRARRCYRVTKTARAALLASQRALMNLWAGIDLVGSR